MNSVFPGQIHLPRIHLMHQVLNFISKQLYLNHIKGDGSEVYFHLFIVSDIVEYQLPGTSS